MVDNNKKVSPLSCVYNILLYIRSQITPKVGVDKFKPKYYE